ncbi:hypothetical protein FQR65_LT05906 [Abscondita terminalis]|nr:hypothetical protein FQR65_LT05906 [Abscondita terminalis]
MVNTRKRSYKVDVYAKDDDQLQLVSTMNPPQSNLSFIDVKKSDLVPRPQADLHALQICPKKHQLYRTDIKLLSVSLLCMIITIGISYSYCSCPIYKFETVLTRYVSWTRETQDNETLYLPQQKFLFKLQKLNIEMKTLKTRCNRYNYLPHILKTVDERIQRALVFYDADKIGIIDYAMEMSGGSITSTPGTTPYSTSSNNNLELFNSKYNSNPNTLIQPGNLPGQCYAFKGPTGKIRFRLMHVVNITAVTLEHAHPKLVIDSRSAPKDFRVYGLKEAESSGGDDLGLFEYKVKENPTQTFHIKKTFGKGYKHVELQVLSNYGNPDYTCVYRFRVHGDIL